MTQLQIRSSIRGRLRLNAPTILDRPDLAAELEKRVQALPGVRSCSAKALTGSVLVVYEPYLGAQAMVTMVATGLTDSRSALPVPAGTPDRGGWSPVPGENPFISYLKHSPKHAGMATTALGIAFADRLFEAAPPAMVGAGIDLLTRGPHSMIRKLGFRSPASQLTFLGSAAAVVWVLDSFFSYLHTIQSDRLAIAIQNDLRNEVYRHLQELDPGVLEMRPVSAWMSVLDGDLARIGKFIALGVDPIITIVANCVIVLTTFFATSPLLAFVHLSIGPAVYLISRALLKKILKRYELTLENEGRLSAMLHGNIEGMATIASFTQQDYEARRVAHAGEQWAESMRQMAELSACYVPAIQLTVGAGFLSTLIYGAALVKSGDVTTGAYNSMSFASLRLLTALGRLGMSAEQYQRARVSMTRVIRTMDRKPAVTAGPGQLSDSAARGEIVFDNVTFGYDAEKPVLRGVSLVLPGGKTSALVGPTGAGKTTVLKLLLRFYDQNEGMIRIGGVDTREVGLDALRGQMALVPQNTFLFGGTVRENIAYARPDASDAEVKRAAQIAGADSFIEELPQGYHTPLNERTTQLSGGQQQRIAIARAVLSDRSVLLFDEATSAIDFETEASIQNSLRVAAEGRTILLIAHRLSTVRNADVIYVMDEGRVIEQGRHEELVRANGLYAALWRIQTGESAADAVAQPEGPDTEAAPAVEPPDTAAPAAVGRADKQEAAAVAPEPSPPPTVEAKPQLPVRSGAAPKPKKKGSGTKRR